MGGAAGADYIVYNIMRHNDAIVITSFLSL